jgi:hypothetical protein
VRKAFGVDILCRYKGRIADTLYLRDNVSLARQWNVTLEAEKDSAKAAMRWRVEQILLGKKFRHRLE